MKKASLIRTRLRGYFDKHAKPLTVAAIANHHTDVKMVTLNYHLQQMLKDGFLIKPKRGTYQKNSGHQTIEQKRQTVAHHIATNGSRIQSGEPWKPGLEALTETVNPVAFALLGRSFGESIVERMSAAGFTKADVRFIESLLSRIYPLTTAQRTQAERAHNVET
ncbi:MAG TPA: hypothetical protein VGG51_13820 [Candidatus Cybelea sp.]|jgi:hypothetical protein